MKKSVLLSLLLIIISNLSAQVKTKIYPIDITIKEFPLIEFKAKKYFIKATDQFLDLKNQANSAIDTNVYRVSLKKDIEIDILENSLVYKEKNNLIYAFSIDAEEANSLSLQFSEFYLSNNSILSIYTKNELTDSITSKENNIRDRWGTRTYKGKKLFITLSVPEKEMLDVRLRVCAIFVGYRDYQPIANFGNPGASASCNVNVVCPIGAGWANERNSVAIVEADDSHFSGVLVMNTCGTNRPYFLTANHARAVKPNVQDYVFQFLFYSTDCNTNTGYREDLQFFGSTLKSANASSDFALLELNQIPAPNSGLSYAGWDRTLSTFSSTIALHHPAADVMKISQDYQSAQTMTLQGSSGDIHVWRTELDIGGFEGGSSGGPLFNQSHRIIGQIFGKQTVNVGNPCHPELFSGRFNVSWQGGGADNNRLSNWLDPANTGATETNTTSISNLLPFQSANLVISGNNFFCTGTSQYTLNVPAGTSISWQSSNPNIATISATGNPATVTRIMDGSVMITATINVCNTQLLSTKDIGIGIPYIELVAFSNGANEEQYFCTSHYGNEFQPFFSFTPENSSVEYRVLSWPSLSLVYTDPNQYPVGLPIPMNYMSTPGSYVVVEIRLNTPCGSTGWMGFEVEYVDCSTFSRSCSDCKFNITVSPNPSDGDLKVTIDQERPEVKALSKNEKIKYFLYDFNKIKLVKQWIFDNDLNQRILNLRDIKAGQYILVVSKGKYRQSAQIIIK